MLPKPEPSLWWCFFPFHGLVLTDESDEPLHRPLWGDCTVISGDSLARYQRLVASNNSVEWQPSTYQHETYMGVCRRTRLNTMWWGEERSNEDVVRELRERAGQVAAALTVIMLGLSPQGLQCGLDDQFHEVRESLNLLNLQNNMGLQITGFGSRVDTFDRTDPGPLNLSVADLQAQLADPWVLALAETVAPQRSSLAASLRTSIQQSCVRLAQAIHAVSYTDQVLGVITCIELLVSDADRPSKFDQMTRRLETLLGKELITRYHLRDILQARHLYVHGGKLLLSRTLPLQAVAIGVAALCAFATLAQGFHTKTSILGYLDMFALAQRIDDSWAHQSIEVIRWHHDVLPPPSNLPIWTYVDETLTFDDEFNQGFYDRFDRVFEKDPPQE